MSTLDDVFEKTSLQLLPFALFVVRGIVRVGLIIRNYLCPPPPRIIVRPPWIWLGVQTEDGPQDLTDQVTTHLKYGQRVTKEDVWSWVPPSRGFAIHYVDLATLEDRELSSEGIVIEYASPYTRSRRLSDCGAVCSTPECTGAGGVDCECQSVERHDPAAGVALPEVDSRVGTEPSKPSLDDHARY